MRSPIASCEARRGAPPCGRPPRRSRSGHPSPDA
jgi:hypothetical protein